MAYFGTAQSPSTADILPITARMFLLTGDMLAVVDATSAGATFKSATPVSREVKIDGAKKILKSLAALLDK